jgi:putative transposase
MRDLATLFVHLIWTVFRLLSPGGVRSVVAESVLLRHPLVILNRPRERAPNLRRTDRLIAGPCALLIRPARVLRTAVVLKPSTLMGLHHALVKRKYRRLFTPRRRGSPGPKGPSLELVDAILEMKNHRLLALRVTDPENPLGHGRDGSVHAADRRLLRAPRSP